MRREAAVTALLIGALLSGCLAQRSISQALFLGNVTNATRDDCVWRRGGGRDACPDPDVRFYFYSSAEPAIRKTVNLAARDWLRTNGWNSDHDTVVLIHGYGGKDGSFPMVILRDAYLSNGTYNVFTVDWGPLCRPPCYAAAVHNMKPVARCLSQLFTFLRSSGVQLHRTTCVGHSLGAHVCGLVSLTLLFRMHRIIGLDPARPLIRGPNRLRNVDANVVQVIHTNAGVFGEDGPMGVIDFCVNGGREQPSCKNKTHAALCSHVTAVCYMAESINTETARVAETCSTRRCPSGSRRRPGAYYWIGGPVIMGQHTPDSAAGIFCVANMDEPYCPGTRSASGDIRCCKNST
ncbi:phospholipase A1 VesT1.02 [Cryptotermes secundus]|uniref:phospholipase A1 VesT1.02 n=1 Tax=Cryptotermes secundus TaxID=105785 RepID=UPI001454DA42|nr:phospholipase A1 VesT1.02 [Cryptotermes secundus]